MSTSPPTGKSPSRASSPTVTFVPGIEIARSISQASRSRLRATDASRSLSSAMALDCCMASGFIRRELIIVEDRFRRRGRRRLGDDLSSRRVVLADIGSIGAKRVRLVLIGARALECWADPIAGVYRAVAALPGWT